MPDLGILCLAVPQPPMQPLERLHNHHLRRHSRRIIGRQGISDLPQVLAPHCDIEPVQNRQFHDAGIGKNTSKARTPIGEGRQHGAFGSADGVEAPADQHFHVRVGSGEHTENLAATRLRFNVANPHLKMALSVLATPDERGIQGDRDRRRRRVRLDRGTIPKGGAGLHGTATHGLFVIAGSQRDHLLQQIRRRPIGHEGREMNLKLIQFRCRPAMRWPVDPDLDCSTSVATKSRKSRRELTEKRGDQMLPVVLDSANTAAASTIRATKDVASGLSSDDLPLDPRQQQLGFGQAQTQTGGISEINGLADLHDVRTRAVTLSAGFHQP
jgi:hypothetical protein